MRLRSLARKPSVRRGSQSSRPLLIDTTYLLPLFGVSITLPQFRRVFPHVAERHELYYNPASLIEAKWIILGLARNHPSKMDALLAKYIQGLLLLGENGLFKPLPLTGPEVEEESDRLLKEGLRDYFDRLIYATAAVHGVMLLTEDRELHQQWEKDQARGTRRPPLIMDWKVLLNSLRPPR